jgi:hypothetical protein
MKLLLDKEGAIHGYHYESRWAREAVEQGAACWARDLRWNCGKSGPFAFGCHRARDLALFNLAIDSKLRGCDLVRLRVQDVMQGSRVAPRSTTLQKKTQRPVQFEITEQTRDALPHGSPRRA